MEFFGPNNNILLSSDGLKCRIYDKEELKIYEGWHKQSRRHSRIEVNFLLFSADEKDDIYFL